jgi:hypothetical protein
LRGLKGCSMRRGGKWGNRWFGDMAYFEFVNLISMLTHLHIHNVDSSI